MTAANAQQDTSFTSTNPHALASILEASQTKSIIASRDIFDISGTKLWARDMPVSQALQRKLLDRQLMQPLESCLVAEDGVTGHSLLQAVESLLAHSSPLSTLLRPHAARILKETPHIHLHPVAQLLLTASQASRQQSFEHAIEGMALCGALMAAHEASTQDVRLAMMCGLLHDLGEMYIDPKYGEADVDGTLDLQSYQHLVVHPHVGGLLIEQLTDYPRLVARAVSEHHERLDGSGYPRRLQRDSVSALGRLLCVAEATLRSLRQENSSLARASVALRVVPGEYELSCVGLVSHAARQLPAPLSTHDLAEIQVRLGALDATLQNASDKVAALMPEAESPELKESLALAHYLLGRLRAGWNASGLWGREALAEHEASETEAIEDELLSRLWAIQRSVMLHAGKLPAEDAQRLHQLFESLSR